MSTVPVDPPARPLGRAVDAACTELARRVSPATAAGIAEVSARLRTPLQVAVVGRVSAGKSTLVNALIGRRVAPTAAGECTRLVTRFSAGSPDRVTVVLRDGRSVELPFEPDGTIPRDVATRAGVTLADVSHLEATLTSATLAELTVIDTPGLGSLDADSAGRSAELLEASTAPTPMALAGVQRSAVVGAEAVLYVLAQQARADDADAVAGFTAATSGRDAGAVTVLGVLTKVDTLAPETVHDDDGLPARTLWRAAELIAEAQARALGPRVADVLPVVGLLAETCEAGGFTAADADALRTLAGEDEATRTAMLAAPDLFTSLDSAVAPAVREALLERLDLYGTSCALRALAADPEMSAGRLRAALHAASGVTLLRRRLHQVLTARTDAIKAGAALGALAALVVASGSAAELTALRGCVEQLLRRPEAHQLRVVEALTQLTSGTVSLEAHLVTEAVRLGSETAAAARLGVDGTREQLAAHALERAGWWRSFASFGAAPDQARVAHVVHRAYFLLWQELTG